jgi:hypothetical protein
MKGKNLKEIRENGYTIIKNIFTKTECNNYIKDIWKFLENLGSGIKKKDKKTWLEHPQGNWPSNIYGIIKHYQVGHTDFVWDIRQNPRVIRIFEDLWNDEELLVSFDGIGITKPGSLEENNDYKSWFHVDQGPGKLGKHCYQSFINLEHTDEEDSSFMVIEGSHKYHTEMFENNKYFKDIDWYKLKDSDLDFIKSKGLVVKKLVIPKGAMVVWDSRTIHCNIGPEKESKRFRYVVYVCMTPKKLCDQSNLEKRISAFKDIMMTSHWPHQVNLYSKEPKILGGKEQVYNRITTPPKLSDIGLNLVGF